ncbi:MAG TPA: hypothetical protein VGE10_01745 [Zeimonas sp.]
MIRSQAFTLPIGGSITLPVQCDYIKYSEGAAGGASTRIRVKTERGGTDLEMSPGDWVRLTERTAQINISNLENEATIIGRVVLGVGSVGSERIAGVVEVVNSEQDTALSGRSFSRAMFPPIAVPGEWSYIQLWNPAGSGKNVIVESLILSSEADDHLHVGFSPTQVALSAGNFSNKFQGKSGSISESRYGTSAGDLLLGSPSLDILGMKVSAKIPIEFPMKRPLIVTPGYGMTVRVGEYAVGVAGWVELLEIDQ